MKEKTEMERNEEVIQGEKVIYGEKEGKVWVGKRKKSYFMSYMI